MPLKIITSAQAQVPRGESGSSYEEDGGGPFVLVFIFAIYAIVSAFKRSRAEGAKVLGFCASVVLLVIYIPAVGMIVVGVLGLMICWGLVRSLM
jgi:uncharacterized membrane protein YiaA